MATQADFSPEDWSKVFSAPFVAGMYISFADVSNPVGLMQETAAVVQSDMAATQASMLATIEGAIAAVEAKDAEAVAGYKQLIMDAATKAAGAAKEGGFMGIGGTSVSDAEKAALAQIATTLGIAA